MVAGDDAIRMPAAFIASIFSLAVPLPPEMIAPACPIRLARRRGLTGDKSDHRFFHIGFDPSSSFFLRAAADLADHDDRFGARIVIEHIQNVDEFQTMHRITANAYAGRLSHAKTSQLIHRFIGQRAAARNHADTSLAMNMPGHDADLTLAGSNQAGTIGS